jgi:hypothetical protein
MGTNTSMSPRERFTIGFVSLLMAAFAGMAPARAQADVIDDALREEAPKIMKYIKDHGYHTVGVLKFVVKKGNQPVSLNAGTLNTKIARSLEHALILLNDPSKPIDIIKDASKAAAGQSRSATFRSPKGRRGLLDHTYPLAWGPQHKHPDAFLTGEVLVAKDMKTLTLVIAAFDRKKPDTLAEVLQVKNLPVNRDILAGIGQSFVLPRKLSHHGARDLDEAASTDAAANDKTGASPASDADDPVKLQIFYDDQLVNLDADPTSPGELKVRRNTAKDPKEGQKVKFVIANTTQDTVGVVLAIDGKSTLFAEDLANKQAGECTKWMLGPGQTYTIEGFYMSEDGKELHPFKVLSDDDSAKVDLAPEQKGVFSMFVFRPGGSTSNSESLNVSAADGELSQSPKTQPATSSLADVQAGIRAVTHTRAVNGRLVAEHVVRRPVSPRHVTQKGGRGLIVQDTQATSGGNLNRVDSKLDSQPAMSLFIRYWTAPATTTATTTTPG